MLNPDDLSVETFDTIPLGPDGECCTGCVSGCGYIPTQGGCESADTGDVFVCAGGGPVPGGGDCCTGCVSGCGLIPTEGGCESAGPG